MMYYLYAEDLDKFTTLLTENNESIGRHLLVYATRGSEKVLNVHLCSDHEWRTFYGKSYESEYMKRNIDIVIDMEIGTETANIMTVYLERNDTDEDEKNITQYLLHPSIDRVLD